MSTIAVLLPPELAVIVGAGPQRLIGRPAPFTNIPAYALGRITGFFAYITADEFGSSHLAAKMASNEDKKGRGPLGPLSGFGKT